MLRVDGAPVGRVLTTQRVPSPYEGSTEKGSIIVVLATVAPLPPHQCKRLAQRASIGLGHMGGCGDGSGDIFLAFATGNTGIPPAGLERMPTTIPLTMIPNERMTPLFYAAAEAILNALLAAGTVKGAGQHYGVRAHARPPARCARRGPRPLRARMREYRHAARPIWR